MEFLKKSNFYNFTLTLSILLVSLAVTYYYVVYLPRIDNNKLQNEKYVSDTIKECENRANNASWQTSPNRFLGEIFDEDKYELLYKQCLRSKGLK